MVTLSPQISPAWRYIASLERGQTLNIQFNPAHDYLFEFRKCLLQRGIFAAEEKGAGLVVCDSGGGRNLGRPRDAMNEGWGDALGW